MAPGRQRLKTDSIQLRIEPQLKLAAEEAAKREHRNLTNWIETLILARLGQLNITVPTVPSRET